MNKRGPGVSVVQPAAKLYEYTAGDDGRAEAAVKLTTVFWLS
jgi:hypothetical protein